MTVPFERDFDPSDNFPSVVMDALQRMITALAGSLPCPIRIKPGAANTLQVPAGAGQDAVGLAIEGHWRWIEAPAEQTASGSLGLRDVWACATASDYEDGSPGETDATDRSFVLRVTAADASAPTGFAHTRRIARAEWSGSTFVSVAPIVGTAILDGLQAQPGDVKASARATPPPGWLLCDGSPVSRSTYASLHAAIKDGPGGFLYPFGVGNGSTTFNLPDFRGRVLVGADEASARLALSNRSLGQTGGEEVHTLSSPELPANLASWGVLGNAQSGVGTTYPNQLAGSGQPHNNMQLYQLVNWFIKT